MQQGVAVQSVQTESVYSVVFKTTVEGVRYEILNIAGERKPPAEIARDLQVLAKKIWLDIDDG